MLLALGACSPKTTGVLKSPSHVEGQAHGQSGKHDDKKPSSTISEHASKEEKAAHAIAEKRAKQNGIALLLPFQLDKLNPDLLSKADITRSAMALDFYQGFQMGLDEVAKQGKSFVLDVIDSRDDESQNALIAKAPDLSAAALVVGPVYPKEIKAFGANLLDKNVLQINPLAASKASEYDLPNLVSLTPSINIHSRALATKIARDYGSGDVVLVYNTGDADGRQFLAGFVTELRRVNAKVQVQSVSSITQLNEAMTSVGSNLIAVGTTDKQELRSFLNNLDKKVKEGYYTFRLYGHPLWDRIDFSGYPNFENYNPVISTESHLKSWTTAVKKFKDDYTAAYGVVPSDHSYKGYDVARYFGGLLSKYGMEYPNHLTKETFDGLYSAYRFEKSPTAGYTNQEVSFKVYKGSSFQLN